MIYFWVLLSGEGLRRGRTCEGDEEETQDGPGGARYAGGGGEGDREVTVHGTKERRKDEMHSSAFDN